MPQLHILFRLLFSGAIIHQRCNIKYKTFAIPLTRITPPMSPRRSFRSHVNYAPRVCRLIYYGRSSKPDSNFNNTKIDKNETHAYVRSFTSPSLHGRPCDEWLCGPHANENIFSNVMIPGDDSSKNLDAEFIYVNFRMHFLLLWRLNRHLGSPY